GRAGGGGAPPNGRPGPTNAWEARGGSTTACPGDHDRADHPPGRVRAVIQSHGRLRGVAIPGGPSVLPIPAWIRVRRGGALLRSGHGGGRGGVGELQLARRRRGREPQQLSELLEER